jgi:hypothetical protein
MTARRNSPQRKAICTTAGRNPQRGKAICTTAGRNSPREKLLARLKEGIPKKMQYELSKKVVLKNAERVIGFLHAQE